MSRTEWERRAPDHELTQGDVGVGIEDVLLASDGDPADLSGIGSVRYQARFPGAASLEIDAVGTVVGTPTDGRVRYVVVSNDTDTPGALIERWKVTYAGGAIEYFPSRRHKLSIQDAT